MGSDLECEVWLDNFNETVLGLDHNMKPLRKQRKRKERMNPSKR